MSENTNEKMDVKIHTRALNIASMVLVLMIMAAIVYLIVLELNYKAPEGIKGETGANGDLEPQSRIIVRTSSLVSTAFIAASSIQFSQQWNVVMGFFTLFANQGLSSHTPMVICNFPWTLETTTTIGSCTNTSLNSTGVIRYNNGQLFLICPTTWHTNDRIIVQILTVI